MEEKICPIVAIYERALEKQRKHLKSLPIGSRYPAEKDEAALVRMLQRQSRQHDCVKSDCEWAAQNLQKAGD